MSKMGNKTNLGHRFKTMANTYADKIDCEGKKQKVFGGKLWFIDNFFVTSNKTSK